MIPVRTAGRAGAVLLLATALVGSAAGDDVPRNAIRVPFTVDRPGYVTLVIEDAAGNRVHNAVSATYFDAGEHAVWWDGYDVGEGLNFERGADFGPTIDLERHLVPPGTYRLRGLVRDGVRLRYEMSVQSPGSPPWHSDDGSGAWLSDHSIPIAALFLPRGSAWGDEPQVLLAAPIAETGHACIWVTLSGRKLYGKLLGGMRGAAALARDTSPHALPSFEAYSLGAFRGEVKIIGHDTGGAHHELIRVPPDALGPSYGAGPGGKRRLSQDGVSMAVYGGTAAISLPEANRLLFVGLGVPGAAAKGLVVGVELPSPRGLLADRNGRLLAVTGKQIKRFDVDWTRGRLTNAQTVVSTGLEVPFGIARDGHGNLYVSDRGNSHQVKVFDPNGRLLRVIGKPGGHQIGFYDELRMNNPAGVAVDSAGQLWVAEASYVPKRISVWSTEGAFLRAYYGPPKYGGGGVLDPVDKTRFYYTLNSTERYVGIEFELDWESGNSRPKSIYSLAGEMPGPWAMIPRRPPEQPIYLDGRQYMTNAFNAHARGPVGTVGIWIMREDGLAKPVAAAGFPGNKWDLFQRDDIQARLARMPGVGKKTFFVWSDRNGDGGIQADELQFAPAERGPEGMHVTGNLDFVSGNGLFVKRTKFDPAGVPFYDVHSLTYLTEPVTVARGRPVVADDGWVVLAGGPVCGFQHGRLRWSFPCRWPERGRPPLPTHPGDIQAIARLMGYPLTPRGGEAGQLWAVAGDKGVIFVSTTDGLFVAELGGDARITPWLRTPQWHRGMTFDRISFREEHFWPSMTQTSDGAIYLCAGKEHSSIFAVEGLETVRRVDFGRLTVTPEMLDGKPPTCLVRSRVQAEKSMTVAIRSAGPTVDGNLGDWPVESWTTLPLGLEAAVCVSGEMLFAAYRVGDPGRLANSGARGWKEIFATGGGLDLMVRPNPNARPVPKLQRHHRQVTVAAGDVRLFVTRRGDPVSGPLVAVRFQQIGGQGEPVTYVSPIRAVKFDSVTDVTGRVVVAQSGGNYEIAVPLELIGLEARDGLQTKGDVGVLLGSAGRTQARLYWSAGTANIVSDVPSEADLEPHRWGTWRFTSSP